jgi:hypothetical protein
MSAYKNGNYVDGDRTATDELDTARVLPSRRGVDKSIGSAAEDGAIGTCE